MKNKLIRIVLLSFIISNLVACSEKDVKVEDVQIKAVKEVGSNKEEQLLEVDGVDLASELRNFDEAHFRSDSINMYDESTYVYIELSNSDYQNAYIDYLDYMSGRYPSNATCTVRDKQYTIWDGKGYRVGLQLDSSDESKNLYLFKWTDENTKNACNEALNKLYMASDEKLDKLNDILDDLDSQYPNIDEELREIFYTNSGTIQSSDGSLNIELNQERIYEIQSIVENSTIDVGDSIQDLNLEDTYFIVTLRSDDGIINYELVADRDSKEFYIKEGRVIDIDEDKHQENSLSQYLFSLINRY